MVKKKDHNEIKVEFYHYGDDVPFAYSSMPVDQIPDTFELNMTIHMGDNKWRVRDAKPPQKIEFEKSGILKLYVSKNDVTQMNPEEILYSLPTINDKIAEVEPVNSPDDIIFFLEDDWRQVEFISREYESLIEEELRSIHNVLENDSKESAYLKCHVRKKITDPLINTDLTIEQLSTFFNIEKTYAGVSFNSPTLSIIQGFGLLTQSGWILWGQINESGIITALNVGQTKKSDLNDFTLEIRPFLEKKTLFLVEWPSLFWCGLGKLDFMEYQM